jgi:hypothetical protein
MTDAFLADALKYIAQERSPGRHQVVRMDGGGLPALEKGRRKTAFVVSEFKAGGRRIEAEAVQAIVNPLFGEPAPAYTLDRRGDASLALNLRPRSFCLDPGWHCTRHTQ